MRHKTKDILTVKSVIRRIVRFLSRKVPNGKEFKDENTRKNNKMSIPYKTYAQAAANRKRDEITTYDPVKKAFFNIKIFSNPRGFGSTTGSSIW